MNLIISFTKDGNILGEKIEGFLESKHIKSSEYKKDIKDYIKENWEKLNSIVFISSTGIAIRYIKDFIISKDIDPAVIVIDQKGKFVISLLSGHLGGANELCNFLSEKLNSTPVITTATDLQGIESVDVYSKKHNLEIENLKNIKDISKLMLENKKVGFYSEISLPTIKYKNIVKINSLENLENLEGLIVVSNKITDKPKISNITLRPKNIVVGIGCRKNTPKENIVKAVNSELKRLNLSKLSIYKFATIDVKKDEIGIIETAKEFNRELKIFTTEEVSKVDHLFKKSQFVKDTIGVYSVSEPVCHLLGGEILSGKEKYQGITISIGVIKKWKNCMLLE